MSEKKPNGRPPIEFKEEYCKMLIDHMAKGFSFETFAATIGTGKDALYEFVKEHQSFFDAKRIGDAACQKWWEEAGHKGMHTFGQHERFNATVWVFSMKNRFNWRDKQDIAVTDWPSAVEKPDSDVF